MCIKISFRIIIQTYRSYCQECTYVSSNSRWTFQNVHNLFICHTGLRRYDFTYIFAKNNCNNLLIRKLIVGFCIHRELLLYKKQSRPDIFSWVRGGYHASFKPNLLKFISQDTCNFLNNVIGFRHRFVLNR